MEFTGVLEKFGDSTVGYELHIKLPDWVFREMIAICEDKRVICTFNGNYTHHAAMMPKGDFHYIMLNREIAKKQQWNLGDEIHVVLEKDTSKYGMVITEEMQAVLESDPEGSSLFHNLTAGKQRTLIHVITKIKSSQLRIERSFVILEHLKRQKGKLDYKILDADFKNYRDKMSF